MTTFERIKKISKKRGYTLKKLAKKANLSENVIYSWKRKVPSTKSLEKIATALDVELSQIIDKNSETPKPKEVDIDDLDTVMRFGGKEIPEEDRETIINMLESLRRARKEKDDK